MWSFMPRWANNMNDVLRAGIRFQLFGHARIVGMCGLLLAAGMAITSCGDSETSRHLISLTVTPSDVEAIAPTGTAHFGVTGTFDKAPITDANVAVQWTTSDSAVATVTTNGSATCLAAGGPITVRASGHGATGIVSASATLTCLSTNPSIGLGKCVVSDTNTLTGYCVGPRAGICREAYDPANCPPETPVTNLEANQCAQSSFRVDTTRTCTP